MEARARRYTLVSIYGDTKSPASFHYELFAFQPLDMVQYF
jgi:hypothetical protein